MLGSPRSRCRQIQCLVRAHFLVHRQLMFWCVLTWQKGAWELSGVSFIRALILSWGASTSLPNHLPKAPPPNSITFGVRISAYKFWENTDLQPRALIIALFGSVDTIYPIYYLFNKNSPDSKRVIYHVYKGSILHLICSLN